MVHRRKRGPVAEKGVEPNISEIIAQIETEIEGASKTEPIKEYAILGIKKRFEETYERISEKNYRKAYESAKKLASLLDRGDPKHLNRWGA